MNNAVTLFCSQDPAAYAEAVATLKSANIPFQAYDSREGSTKFPRTMHMIAVSSENENAARNAIASIPSEIIFSSAPSAPSRGDRAIAWIQILLLLLALLLGAYKSFF